MSLLPMGLLFVAFVSSFNASRPCRRLSASLTACSGHRGKLRGGGGKKFQGEQSPFSSPPRPPGHPHTSLLFLLLLLLLLFSSFSSFSSSPPSPRSRPLPHPPHFQHPACAHPVAPRVAIVLSPVLFLSPLLSRSPALVHSLPVLVAHLVRGLRTLVSTLSQSRAPGLLPR
eukprot:766859-Hanusia_phi.AAC.1